VTDTNLNEALETVREALVSLRSREEFVRESGNTVFLAPAALAALSQIEARLGELEKEQRSGPMIDAEAKVREGLQDVLDPAYYERFLDDLLARLAQAEAALRTGKTLVAAMDLKMPEQATEDEDGFINSYRIPVGPWHRLLAWAQGSFVATTTEEGS
jgi:hypothetical protein